MTEEEKKKQQQGDNLQGGALKEDELSGIIKAQKDEARRLRDYAASPVETDTEGQVRPYDAFLQSNAARMVETPEQQAAREKREKTGRQLTALSDGLAALGNVTGAMFGATPVRASATLSAAHRKAVEAAAERRRNNARQYEIARQNAVLLQTKQDEENGKRRANEVKARRDADRQASGIEQGLIKVMQAQRNYELTKGRMEESARHNKAMEGQRAQRISMSGGRKNISEGKSGKSGKGDADYEEYARWQEEHLEEVDKLKRENGLVNQLTGQQEHAVSGTFVKIVNARMRRKYGGGETGIVKVTGKKTGNGGGYKGIFK